MISLNDFVRVKGVVSKVVYIKTILKDSENDYSQYVIDDGEKLTIVYDNQIEKVYR